MIYKDNNGVLKSNDKIVVMPMSEYNNMSTHLLAQLFRDGWDVELSKDWVVLKW